jgi:lipopolysaccharide export LptBFGC system permease protein LptF
VLLEVIDGNSSFQLIFLKIIDFIILFWDLIISLSFIIAFCFYFIKFSKSFELTAIRSLGISNKRIYTPIFFFSIFCGFLIYLNQSYFAPYRQAT